MSRRKRKFTYKDGDGNKYKIEASMIDLSKGSLEELIGDALDAEEDDRVIKEKSKEIKKFINKNIDKKDKLDLWYSVGKKLQFVDNLSLNQEEDIKEAFKRLFEDLETTSAWNTKDSKAIRYPQHMYTLYKIIPKKIVFHKGMTWSKWFDILEYKNVVRNKKVLKELIHKCTKENWTAEKLRNKLQNLNKKLAKK